MQIATNYTVLLPFFTFFQFRLEQHEALKIKYHSKLHVHRLIDFISFFYLFNCFHVHIHLPRDNFSGTETNSYRQDEVSLYIHYYILYSIVLDFVTPLCMQKFQHIHPTPFLG